MIKPLILILSLFISVVSAQDVIFLKSGDSLVVNVSEKVNSKIYFTEIDNDAHFFSIDTSKIKGLKYCTSQSADSCGPTSVSDVSNYAYSTDSTRKMFLLRGSEHKNNQVFRMLLYPIGLSYEKKISEKKSIIIDAGFTYVFNMDSVELYYQPFIQAQFRSYMNIKDKTLIGEKTDYRGGYLAYHIKYAFAMDIYDSYLQTGPMLGYQLNPGGIFYLRGAIGLGVKMHPPILDNNAILGVMADIKFGFSIY